MTGIHHVTAIASDPQSNFDFYTGVLGLRFVKKTVNFDDAGTYHLYFGDEAGRPGTIMTFFPWPRVRQGTQGAGQVTVTSFSVPSGSLEYWEKRLRGSNVRVSPATGRFEEEVLRFRDPDGLELELVAHEGAAGLAAWEGGGVPGDAAIRGFQGVTLTLEGYEATAALLTGLMGYRPGPTEDNRFRFLADAEDGPGLVVDLLCSPDSRSGIVAGGTVHHVAFRVPDDEAQQEIRERLVEAGLNVTPVLDRNYFRSIYFREPGGVLFEIATDPPGFTVDESLETLGTELKLPDWIEPRRAEIERALPALIERR